MIIGAGLAGLIAARVFPTLPILEAAPEPVENHKALLRFRSDAVARLTGIDFRQVTVRKGIWEAGAFRSPDIRLANLYAQKCIGRLLPRSIWNLEPVERWIAPPDFYQQLVDGVRSRIQWGAPVDFSATRTPVVSTAPLPVVAKQLRLAPEVEFERASIVVSRWRVPGADVHQTIHFPSPEHSLYRASITGDLLIAEFAGRPRGRWIEDISQAFALPDNTEKLEEVSQKYGKIAPIPEGERKALVARLTQDHDIYSLGRFATWRNLLLDDVVDDATKIKRLMASSGYDRRLAAL